MKPDVYLPVQRVINSEEPLGAYEPKTVPLYEELESIARIPLKICGHLVLGLQKGHFENEMTSRLEHSEQLSHYFFGILDVLEDCDAQNCVEIIVCYRYDVKRRVDIDVGTVVTGPREVLID